jgi:hypothetical protein
VSSLGAWITNVVNLAATSLALPLLAVAALLAGVAFLTGNRDAGKAIAISGLIGFGIITAINPIISTIPKAGG